MNKVKLSLIVLFSIITILTLQSCGPMSNEPEDPLQKKERPTVSDNVAKHISKNGVRLWANYTLITFSSNTGKDMRYSYDESSIIYHRDKNVIEIPLTFKWTAKKSFFDSNRINCIINGTLYIQLNYVDKDDKTKTTFIADSEENVSDLYTDFLGGNPWPEWKKGVVKYLNL